MKITPKNMFTLNQQEVCFNYCSYHNNFEDNVNNHQHFNEIDNSCRFQIKYRLPTGIFLQLFPFFIFQESIEWIEMCQESEYIHNAWHDINHE